MIEGLQYDFSSEELGKHIESRIEHHEKRAKEYVEQASNLRESGASAFQEASRMSSRVTTDPVVDLEDRGQSHVHKADKLKLLKEHLISDEVYRLKEHDLERLEIVRYA